MFCLYSKTFDRKPYPLVLFFDTDSRSIHFYMEKRKHYTFGKDIIDQAIDCIRKQIETMSRLDEFVIISTISGGTGSVCLCWFSRQSNIYWIYNFPIF
ncbi:unnamed protein product [Paramecium octaurelia]|uniref:Tubulin/FtsZ GTPase domain-containing protein n=1 Tax=Paramecium octaurelia TaxID=43137 RepID=A0A8S1XA71_PAROT|nr:unnamed protein product [Paramecium octaurelia]